MSGRPISRDGATADGGFPEGETAPTRTFQRLIGQIGRSRHLSRLVREQMSACYNSTVMTLWNLLQDILVAVLLTLPISFVGIAWVNYDDPGAGALKAELRWNAHTGRAGWWIPTNPSPWMIWPGPLCRQ